MHNIRSSILCFLALTAVSGAAEAAPYPTTNMAAGDASSSMTMPNPDKKATPTATNTIIKIGTPVYAGDAGSATTQPTNDANAPAYQDDPHRTPWEAGDAHPTTNSK